MKSDYFSFSKRFFLLPVMITWLGIQGNSQQATPRNYLGYAGIYDAGIISIGAGLEYERWLMVKKYWAIGINGTYIFSHKAFNSIWQNDNLLKSNSQIHLMPTAYFFTNKKNDHPGFIAGFGAGVNHVRFQKIVHADNIDSYTEMSSKTILGIEFSTGIQLNFKRHFGVRLSGGFSYFFGKTGEEYPEEFPILLLFSKISIGF